MSSKTNMYTKRKQRSNRIRPRNRVISFLCYLLAAVLLAGVGVNICLNEISNLSDIKRLSARIEYSNTTKLVDEVGIDEKLDVMKEVHDVWKKNRHKIEQIDGINSYLIIGVDTSDREEEEYCFADLFSVVTINERSEKMTISTLQPEMYVYIPGVGAGRLADAYYYGSIELAVKTVEENLGIGIKNYFLTDYSDFTKLVDEVGGVEIRNLKDKPGKEHMDGVQTVSYLRQFVDNDYRRGQCFQEVSQGIVGKVQQMNSLERFFKLYPYFTTDINKVEAKHVLLKMPEYVRYEIEYVMLNDVKRSDEIVGELLTASNANKGGVNPIKLGIVVYLVICCLLVLWILYLVFLHRRKIVYTDVNTGKVYKSEKTYRWKEKAHPYYYAKVIPGVVNGLFADRELKAEFEQEISMPMNKLYVYCDVDIEENKNEK